MRSGKLGRKQTRREKVRVAAVVSEAWRSFPCKQLGYGHEWSMGYRDAFGPCMVCGAEPPPEWEYSEVEMRELTGADAETGAGWVATDYAEADAYNEKYTSPAGGGWDRDG